MTVEQKPLPSDLIDGKYLQHQVGTITRMNLRTASVDCEAGTGWRVPFAMLSHVMDI